MSEKAIESESEIVFDDGVEEVEPAELVEAEVEEVEAVEAEAEETEAKPEDVDGAGDEIEIIAEGDDEPPSKPARKSRFVRRLAKLKGEVDAAQSETEAEARKRELLEEENKLLRLKMAQKEPSGPPKLEQFDSELEYYQAKSTYDTEQARIAGREEAAQELARAQSQNHQAAVDKERDGLIQSHYDRVDTLNIPDYDQLEDKVIDVMGQNLVTEIIANTDKSHLLIPYLAANLGKAERFTEMSKTQPVKLLMDIGALARDLKVKRKHSPAADPETTIDKGLATNTDGYLKGVRFE